MLSDVWAPSRAPQAGEDRLIVLKFMLKLQLGFARQEYAREVTIARVIARRVCSDPGLTQVPATTSVFMT